jgi:hypothetical protein
LNADQGHVPDKNSAMSNKCIGDTFGKQHFTIKRDFINREILTIGQPFGWASFLSRRLTRGLKEETFVNIYQLMHHHLVIQ